jgi:hypothetical protein
MGKGERRRARPPSHAAHNYRPGIKRKANMIVALVEFSAIKAHSLQEPRKKATLKKGY